jgi:hypothetical protein
LASLKQGSTGDLENNQLNLDEPKWFNDIQGEQERTFS